MYNICSNCCSIGHKAISCKNPIISIGVIAYYKDIIDGVPVYKYLMIRRRHSLGFMDFIRGKYSVYQKEYILNLLSEMSMEERQILLFTDDFHVLWESIWSHRLEKTSQYYYEEGISKEKFNLLKNGVILQPNDVFYNLQQLIEESYTMSQWDEQEWGFPKGRRNLNEKDLDCGMREFTEETGISSRLLKPVENIMPFEEIFTGSNYKSYKHKYYLMEIPKQYIQVNSDYDTFEVSKIEWKSYDDCIKCIRPYNLEKLRVIKNINHYLESSIVVNS